MYVYKSFTEKLLRSVETAGLFPCHGTLSVCLRFIDFEKDLVREHVLVLSVRVVFRLEVVVQRSRKEGVLKCCC